MKNCRVKADIINQEGKLIKSIDFSELNIGHRTITTNINDLASGVYLLSINIGSDKLISIFEVIK